MIVSARSSASRDPGTRTAPPSRTKRRANAAPSKRPRRCEDSVMTASVVKTGLVHLRKNAAHALWWDWLRSSRLTSALVSSRSSPATTKRLQDVPPRVLRECRSARFERSDEVSDVRGVTPRGDGHLREIRPESIAENLRALPPRLRDVTIELCRELHRNSNDHLLGCHCIASVVRSMAIDKLPSWGCVEEGELRESGAHGGVHGADQRVEDDAVLREDLEVRAVGVGLLDGLQLVDEARVVERAAAFRDGLLVVLDDQVEGIRAHEHGDAQVIDGAVSFLLPLPLLRHLEARELGPDARDEQERHHAGEQVDVRNQVEIRVDGLAASFTAVAQ